jgi:ribonuclease G
VRTAAEGASLEDIRSDIDDLMKKWESVIQAVYGDTFPVQALKEINRTTGFLRDILNGSFSQIITDDARSFDEITNYIEEISPEQKDIVKLYQQKKPLFEHYEIEKQILSGFGKHVTFKAGAYLIIEHTEAMHVIDVNSGIRNSDPSLDTEEYVFAINKEAATEVARQLRLRDMGGIIVVDFIDMHKMQHKKDLFDHISQCMETDRAKHQILPLSKFGLMQITRQRTRPDVKVVTQEVCPVCDGSGKVSHSALIGDVLENQIDHLFTRQNEKRVILKTNPYLFAYLTKGVLSKQMRWFLKYGKWVKIEVNSKYSINEFHFYRNVNEPIVFS